MHSNLYFNGEKLTNESIAKAEQFFIDNAQACINEVLSGEIKALSTKVNDPQKYIQDRRRTIKHYTNKTYTLSFTFLQRAYFIQTGKSVALLP